MIALVVTIALMACVGLALVLLGLVGMIRPRPHRSRHIGAAQYGSMRRRETEQLKREMRRYAMRARRELFNELRAEPEP